MATVHKVVATMMTSQVGDAVCVATQTDARSIPRKAQ